MISNLSIIQFQGHKKLNIDFDPRITTFVGASDSGKSSIIRAIRWITENKPTGDSFITHGRKKAVATLTVDGKKIRRYRGEEGNTYSIGDKEFRAFGNSVPPEIESLLNLGPINYQGQLDPPFWFHLSPGQVAKELNAIVNLEVIDLLISAASSRIRKATAEYEVVSDRVESAKTTLKALDWVPKCRKQWNALVALEEDATETAETASKINDLAKQWNSLQEKSEALEPIVLLSSQLVDKHNSWKESTKKKNEIESFKNMADSIGKVRSIPSIQKVEKLHAEHLALFEKRVEIETYIDEVDDLITTIERLRNEEKQLQAELLILAPKECPTCHAPLNLSSSAALIFTCPTSHRSPVVAKPRGTMP